MSPKISAKEKFTSVQKVQAGITKLLQSADSDGVYYRVMRNNEPLGVLLPNAVWDEFLEDIEALSSANFLNSVREARKSDVVYSSSQIKKMHGLK